MPIKFPGDPITCRFTCTNRGTKVANITAKIKINGYVPETWRSLGQVPGGGSRSLTITETVKVYSGGHPNEDADLWVKADGVEVFHEYWSGLYDLLDPEEKVTVGSVVWGSPTPDIAKILAQSYL